MQTKDQTLLEQAYQQVMEASTPQETQYNGGMNATANAIDLTPEQLVTLLSNVYGLIDSRGTLFGTSRYSFQEGSKRIRLYSTEEYLDVSINGASVDGPLLTLFKEEDKEFEQFTLLGTVNGKDLLN